MNSKSKKGAEGAPKLEDLKPVAQEKKPEPAELRAPADWCEVKKVGALKKKIVPSDHVVASSFYQWERQAHMQGRDSFKISRDDYKAALYSAMRFPNVEPHKAAIPPVASGKFAKK